MGNGKVITAADMGRKGGKAAAKTLTKAERSERARKAVTARWAKRKAAVT